MRPAWPVLDHPDGTSTGSPLTRRAIGREIAGLAAVGLIAAAMGAIAWGFRQTVTAATSAVFGTGDPTVAARRGAMLTIVIVATASAVIASIAGRRAISNRRPHGVPAIGAAVRGDGPAPAPRTTIRRAAGTWLASSGTLSIGRESAILEIGGALGDVTARGRLKPLAPALLAGGVAAAFAAAYDAPIAGALYVAEHLRARRNWRTLVYVIAASGIGNVVATTLGGHSALPGTTGTTGDLAVLSAIGFVPAAVGARLFRLARERATPSTAPSEDADSIWRRPVTRRSLGVVAVLAIPAVFLTAGNGMEALQHASTQTTLGVALALAVGKLIATTAALGAGIPGGAFWASLAVPAGWALLTFQALDAAGVSVPGSYWDGMLAAMVIGIAVGMRSPLVATFVVAEMTGQYLLIPLFGAVAATAFLLDRATRHRPATRNRDAVVRDEDA